MSQVLDCMKHEAEKTADVHADLSSQLASAAHRMTEFINRQKAEIKLVSTKCFISLFHKDS